MAFTNPFQLFNTMRSGWGAGWGGYNPFLQKSSGMAPDQFQNVLQIWNTARQNGDVNTLQKMATDDSIRYDLARNLGINVNQLSDIWMQAYQASGQPGFGNDTGAWSPQVRSQYLQTNGVNGQGSNTGSTTTDPYAGMTRLFRDNMGMIHDPGDNPLTQSLNQVPVTNASTQMDPRMLSRFYGRFRPHSGNQNNSMQKPGQAGAPYGRPGDPSLTNITGSAPQYRPGQTTTPPPAPPAPPPLTPPPQNNYPGLPPGADPLGRDPRDPYKPKVGQFGKGFF